MAASYDQVSKSDQPRHQSLVARRKGLILPPVGSGPRERGPIRLTIEKAATIGAALQAPTNEQGINPDDSILLPRVDTSRFADATQCREHSPAKQRIYYEAHSAGSDSHLARSGAGTIIYLRRMGTLEPHGRGPHFSVDFARSARMEQWPQDASSANAGCRSWISDIFSGWISVSGVEIPRRVGYPPNFCNPS